MGQRFISLGFRSLFCEKESMIESLILRLGSWYRNIPVKTGGQGLELLGPTSQPWFTGVASPACGE